MIKQLVVVVLVLGMGLAWAGGFSTSGSYENYQDSARKYHSFIDSLDKAPPWIRAQVLGHHRNDKLFIPDSQNVRCIGRWPFGPSYQVTGQDSFVYLGSGSGVRIINISDPRRPRHIGKVDALGGLGYGGGVARRDSLLYVLSGNYGLQIFNIANPTNPRELGRLPIIGYHQDLSVKDSLAYVVGWDSLLRVISISNPANPQQVGSLKFNNDTWGVDVKDSFAYVANQTSGLRVVNVADSRNPREVGSISSWRALETYASGNLVFVAAGAAGLRIVDVRNPSSPQEIGYLLSTPCRDVMRIGMFAYGIRDSSYNSVFYIIDVSDSTNPSLISYVDPPGWGYALWVLGPYAYAYTADHWEGMHVININDPTVPRVDTTCFGAGESRDVFVLDNRAYLADGFAGLKVLDISNIQLPIEIGCYDTVGLRPDLLSAVWVRDTTAYLGQDINFNPPKRFAVVNTNNPSSIQRIGSCAIPNNIGSEELYLKNSDSILFSVNQSYLYGFKISNPAAPALVCSLLLGSDQAYGVFVKDSFAYVAGGGSLKTVNIASLSSPRVVGACTTGGWARGVMVRNSLAYVAAYTNGLRIINVSNPSAPYEISNLSTRGEAMDVAVRDTIVYIATRNGIQVVNCADSANPREIGYYTTSFRDLGRLFLQGNYIYEALGGAGLFIFDAYGVRIEDERLMQPVRCMSIAPNPSRGTVVASHIFATSGLLKVKVFDIAGRQEKESMVPIRMGCAQIDLAEVSPGVKFLLIEGHKGVVKIIKL